MASWSAPRSFPKASGWRFRPTGSRCTASSLPPCRRCFTRETDETVGETVGETVDETGIRGPAVGPSRAKPAAQAPQNRGRPRSSETSRPSSRRKRRAAAASARPTPRSRTAIAAVEPRRPASTPPSCRSDSDIDSDIVGHAGRKAGHPRRVVFVIEGGRSRDDVAALQAVARAVAEAGRRSSWCGMAWASSRRCRSGALSDEPSLIC